MVPSAYIEKPPFPVRIKDRSKASTVIRRGYIRTPTPPEQIRVEPSIAIIKDLLDLGASVSAIPQSLYDEVKDEIAPVEIEPIDVTIQLANRDTICPMGLVRDVEVLCGKMKYPSDFLVLATAQDSFCPIIFGRPFLNTVNAHIDCEKQTATVGFEGVSHEFNFSKFYRQCSY